MDERNQNSLTHTKKKNTERSLRFKDYKEDYCKNAQSKATYKLEVILTRMVMAIYAAL